MAARAFMPGNSARLYHANGRLQTKVRQWTFGRFSTVPKSA
jgi:hypothetical protein